MDDSVLVESIDGTEGGVAGAKSDGLQQFRVHPRLCNFYASEELTVNGAALAGGLHSDDTFRGSGAVSLYDASRTGLQRGVFVDPGECGSWILSRAGQEIVLSVYSEKPIEFKIFTGDEPDWTEHRLPFHNLPEDDRVRHAVVRGLLDFFEGTRGAPGTNAVFQKPCTNGAYLGDGAPDTYFQFLGAYPFISDLRRGYLESHLDWLGRNMRFDGCIPWGGVLQDKPYYHIWNSPRYGLFFDANALWLDMVYRVWRATGREPSLETVVRACDFYLHYTTENGLVAAESKMLGCEWADLLQNGWHSSLINVLAVRAFRVTVEMLDAFGEKELSGRYRAHGERLRKALNSPVEQGGLWMRDGYADWVDPSGGVHPHYRIDTHALALLFDVPDADQIEAILDRLCSRSWEGSVPPAPYLLEGSWIEPVDDMLEGCRAWDGGRGTMCGRCGATLAAALDKFGRKSEARTVLQGLIDMVADEPGVPEYYLPDGRRMGSISYIEHALSVAIALTLIDENTGAAGRPRKV